VFTVLLIVHGLCAVALLGAITHQALAVWWPARAAGGFVTRFRGVPGAGYTNAIIVLFVLTFLLGAVIYPPYRLVVRTYLENARLWTANGSFELKEQFAAIGLGMLPFYWFVWRQPLDEALAFSRRATAAILCFIVWFGFLVGHVLNNIRGLFGQ
jgi:hypothetical protein